MPPASYQQRSTLSNCTSPGRRPIPTRREVRCHMEHAPQYSYMGADRVLNRLLVEDNHTGAILRLFSAKRQ